MLHGENPLSEGASLFDGMERWNRTMEWNGMAWNDHAYMIVYLVERRLPRAQQKMKRRVALSPSKPAEAANCMQVIILALLKRKKQGTRQRYE